MVKQENLNFGCFYVASAKCFIYIVNTVETGIIIPVLLIRKLRYKEPLAQGEAGGKWSSLTFDRFGPEQC